MEFNKKAWSLLTEDERMALNLQHGHNKSSWQAGEILEKAHYKYLEIKYRAEALFKMFTTHYNIYDNLVPELNIAPEVRLYLELTIEKRVSARDAQITTFKTHPGLNKSNLDKSLIDFIEKGDKSRNLEYENFVSLVKEFDRWNNARILPVAVQEPSAYKRRNKNVYKKQIKLILSLPDLSIDILKKTCFSKRPTGLFVVLSDNSVITVFNVRKALYDKLTSFGFYIFENKEFAYKHGKLLEKYVSIEKRTCKDGLNFWPEYRENMKKAKNYEIVNRIKPNRRYLLMAVANTEFFNHKN